MPICFEPATGPPTRASAPSFCACPVAPLIVEPEATFTPVFFRPYFWMPQLVSCTDVAERSAPVVAQVSTVTPLRAFIEDEDVAYCDGLMDAEPPTGMSFWIPRSVITCWACGLRVDCEPS